MRFNVNSVEMGSCGSLNALMQHVGKKICSLRLKRGWSQIVLARHAGVSSSWVQKAEANSVRKQSRIKFAAVAKALEVEPLAIDPMWDDEPPAGIEGIETAEIAIIPEWTITTSAAVWVPVPICELDTDDPRQRQMIDAGRFRLRIDGDCMEPDYKHDSLIEFQIVRADRDATEVGLSYVICRNDGTATFKTLVGFGDDTLILAALNQKKYPGEIIVPWQEVCRIAEALSVITLRPEARVPKILRVKQGR